MTETLTSLGLLNGELLKPLKELVKLLPGARRNENLNIGTMHRWITHGCQSASGSKVRLEAIRCGSRWLSSIEAVRRFVEALGRMPSEGETDAA